MGNEVVKNCEGCGKPIGQLPASAEMFPIRPVGEDRKADLCLACITAGIKAMTKRKGE